MWRRRSHPSLTTLSSRSDRLAVAAPVVAALCLLHLAWTATTLGGAAATAWFDDLTRLVAALVAAACSAGAALRGGGASRRGWGLMATSALSWAAGEAARCAYVLLGREAPFPSPADVGFLLAIPPAVVAVITFAGHSRLVWRLRSVLDGLIVATALLSVSWAIGLRAVYHSAGHGLLTTALSLVYPVSDVAIGTMLVVLVLRASRPGRLPLLLLSGGLGAAALADSTVAYQSASGGLVRGGVTGTGWVAGYLLIGLAALRASARPLAPVAENPPPSFNRRLLPYLPVGIAAVMAVDLEFFRGHELGHFLFATMLLLIVLVMARQVLAVWDTTRENADLARRLGTRERQLEHQACHDALTDLVNRARFRDLVAEAVGRRTVAGGPPAAVVFIDVDDLTMVNDTIGPLAGDRLLVAIAQRLRACVRPTDTVARVGGDEFAVLIPEVRGSEQLVDVAERILDALSEPAAVGDGVGIRSTVSLGVTVADHPEVGADELLRRADVAMHAAIAGGKGLVGIFEPTLQVVVERPQAARNSGGNRTAAAEPRAEDGTRLWLARELHDGALQTLTTMLLDMEHVRRELRETPVSHRVHDFQASVRSVITGLRRLLGDLRDQSGDDHRLVEDLAELLGQLDGRAGIKGELSVSPSWPSSLSAHIASHLRRIAEEALRNVALHSGATSVRVSLEAEEERLMLTVSDDGRGCPSDTAVSRGGCGLLGMQERALILGGQLEVSSRPGAGTLVRGTFSSRSA